MMYTKSIPIVAALALAPQAMAEPSGNNMLLMSTRDIFGLESRSDSSYNPKAAVCGMGSDCSSCGSGYERCPSSDQYIHCYDASSSATCCSDGTGNSCDTGYYCYPGMLSKTLCCPDGIDKDTCKSLYGATLTSILPSSTATSSSATSTVLSASSAVATSSAVAASSAVSTVSAVSAASYSKISASSAPVVVYDASGMSAALSHNATNATITHSGSSATASSTGSSSSSSSSPSSSSSIDTSGAVHNAASFLALFGAIVVAAML